MGWKKWQIGCPCCSTVCTSGTFCAFNCGSGLSDVYISVYNQQENLIASGYTNTNGCINLDLAATGYYNAISSYPGYPDYTIKNITTCRKYFFVLSQSGVCCGGFYIPNHLTLTDSEGSIDFIYDSNYGFPLWTGGHSVNRLSSKVTTPNNVCLVENSNMGPVRVCYQMICHAGQNPTFSLQRSWSWVYTQGSLVPGYYQDDSGFAPGQLCITAPPPICGNPLTDTASFAANPVSNAPFVLKGTPVAAGSNATGDPVGSEVTISA